LKYRGGAINRYDKLCVSKTTGVNLKKCFSHPGKKSWQLDYEGGHEDVG
jgi:hypothetical protein